VIGITKVALPPVDLSSMPPMYLLSGHLKPPEHQKLKEKLRQCRCPLREFARDATVFIANVGAKRRCELELRKQDLIVVTPEMEAEGRVDINTIRPFRVIKLAWLEASIEMGKAEKFDAFTLLEGEVAVISRRERERMEAKSVASEEAEVEKKRKEVMERAVADAAEFPARKRARYGRQKQAGLDAIRGMTKRLPLLRQSTSSFEGKYFKGDLPEWITKKVTCPVVSCLQAQANSPPPEPLLVLPLHTTGVAE